MSTNPYQTPEGQLTTDDQAYGEIEFFSPSSRINRLRYWAHGVLFALGFYAIAAVGFALFSFVSPWVGGPIIAIAYIALVVTSVIVMIQRLHDLNKTGWLWLLALVPLANIYLIVILIFFKGTPGANNYGLQPPPNKTWHWVLALAFPVLITVILVAVAIPAYNQYLERAGLQGLDAQYEQQSDYPADDATTEGAADDAGYPTEDASATEEQTYESVDEATYEEAPAEEGVIEGEVEATEETETPQ
ncbi:MAG: hypothetical protein B0W54_10605 [Cellvibrio sp. 79]|nr:MAG: hypothetical protein B0W54_10605 [Cellvibrio sp. 79]